MTDAPDPWEQLRHLTLDQLVTQTKLSGSALTFNGHTTPENWPFAVVVAVGKPGNERAVEFARQFFLRIRAAGAPAHERQNPNMEPKR